MYFNSHFSNFFFRYVLFVCSYISLFQYLFRYYQTYQFLFFKRYSKLLFEHLSPNHVTWRHIYPFLLWHTSPGNNGVGGQSVGNSNESARKSQKRSCRFLEAELRAPSDMNEAVDHLAQWRHRFRRHDCPWIKEWRSSTLVKGPGHWIPCGSRVHAHVSSTFTSISIVHICMGRNRCTYTKYESREESRRAMIEARCWTPGSQRSRVTRMRAGEWRNGKMHGPARRLTITNANGRDELIYLLLIDWPLVAGASRRDACRKESRQGHRRTKRKI